MLQSPTLDTWTSGFLIAAAIWNAQYQPEGLYFMVATTHSGKKATQKIIVSN